MAWWLFLSSAAFFLLLFNGVPKAGDEVSMREVTRSLVAEQSVTVPNKPFVGVPGSHGRTVSKYGIGQPIAAVPFEIAGRLVSAPLDEPDAVHGALALALIPVASGGLVAMTYLLGRRLGGSPRNALLVAALASVGTFGLVYGKEFFSEPLVGLLLVVSVERALGDRWTAAFAALSAAAVVHTRAAPLLVVLVVVAWSANGWRRTVRAMWPVAAAAAVILVYGWVRFGSPLETGYTGEGFTTPLADGAWGLLFEPSKSLFLFAPLAVLGIGACGRLDRAQPVAARMILSYALLVFVMTAAWHSWMGGWCWGPRFLMPVVALLAAPLAPWIDIHPRRLAIVAGFGVIGFLISLPALIVPSSLQKDLYPGEVGPSVLEQYRLIDDVVESTADGSCTGAIESAVLHDCTVAFWQVHVARSVGLTGDIGVVLTSIGLLALSGLGARRCVAAVTRVPADRALT